MKTLVVYYSRSGHTKRAAVALSRVLKSDIEEIVDLKDRSGIIGWFYAGRDGYLKKLTKIKRIKKDPKKYKVVIIGTPIWAGDIAPAIRTFITKMSKSFKKVAYFCTGSGIPDNKSLITIKKLYGKPLVARLEINNREMRSGRFYEKVKKFAAKVKSGA